MGEEEAGKEGRIKANMKSLIHFYDYKGGGELTPCGRLASVPVGDPRIWEAAGTTDNPQEVTCESCREFINRQKGAGRKKAKAASAGTK